MKAISYARASQDRTGEELSVDRQAQDQRALAASRGWDLIAEIRDNDVSAAGKRKRPGFEQALAMVKNGEAQLIISTDMSRLTRGKARDEVRLLELGLETGLRLAFVRAPDLDLSTAAGRLTASILIAAARHEIEQKSERQKRAVQQAAEQGRWTGGRRPFGFEPDGVTVREDEAQAIRDGYAALLSGLPVGAVARDWNGRGLLTPQFKRDGSPNRWTTQTVRPTLLNPRYAGLRGGPTINVENKRIKAHRQIMGVATWPALVPESTWRAVHALLTDPGRASPPRSGRALLTGVGVCGVCGAPVHVGASPARRGNPSQRNYRCSGSLGHVGRRAEPIEEYVTELVLERLARDDARDLLIDHDRADVDELRGKALALRNRRRSLLSLVVDGTFSDSEVRLRAADLDEQIEAVELELADAGRVDIIGPLLVADDLSAAWEAYGTDRQRAVIDSLLHVRIHPAGRGTRTFRPESVGIEWKS